MDYIEKSLNEFIEEVKTFEHSYPKQVEYQEEFVKYWNNSFIFFESLIDILGFIEDDKLLFNEYIKRVNFLKDIVTSADFIYHKSNLVKLIKEAWLLVDTDDLKKEQEQYFLKCSFDTVLEKYYQNKIKSIFKTYNIGYEVKNIDSFIKALGDEKNYFEIYPTGYVREQIDMFLSQLDKIPFPSVINNNKKFKTNQNEYAKSCTKIIDLFEQAIKVRAHEFVIFNYFAESYRKSKLTKSPYTAYDAELDCAMQTVRSVELVNCTLQVLKVLKCIYLKSKECIPTMETLSTNEINKNFSSEEIKLLKLRADGVGNLKEIGKQMTPQLSENNVKQISAKVRNRLGADTIDEAVRLYKEQFGKL